MPGCHRGTFSKPGRLNMSPFKGCPAPCGSSCSALALEGLDAAGTALGSPQGLWWHRGQLGSHPTQGEMLSWGQVVVP